jgi:hypothetical protein
MIHSEKSQYAGKGVKLQAWVKHPQNDTFNNVEFQVEDWWDRVYGSSWMFAQGNPACLIYAMRTGFSEVPIPSDNEVLYGHTPDGKGHLIHITEILEGQGGLNESNSN